MKIEYYANVDTLELQECVVKDELYVQFLRVDGTVDQEEYPCRLWDVFESKEEAEQRLAEFKKAYVHTFKRRPDVPIEIIHAYESKLRNIEAEIEEALSGYENFDGIDFCWLGWERGIQIRGYHKQIEGFPYGNKVVVNRTCSNAYEGVRKFIAMWKKVDKPSKIASKKRLLMVV